MTDIIDLAQAREEQLRADALAECGRKASAAAPLPWPRDCGDCGDPIPADRAEVLPNAELCRPCQTRRERPRR
jgi:phage/conjugal plasmid C-4 type zinc finger TraR family protein